MDDQGMLDLANLFLAAWTSQDVERVLGCYTDNLVYQDPNTKGSVRGREAMRRYLGKLFSAWTMTWSLREAHLHADRTSCTLLWHGTFQRVGSGRVTEADGMDLVEVVGERVSRNDVHFDRSALTLVAGLSAGANPP